MLRTFILVFISFSLLAASQIGRAYADDGYAKKQPQTCSKAYKKCKSPKPHKKTKRRK